MVETQGKEMATCVILLVLAAFLLAWGPAQVSAYASTRENAKERMNLAAEEAQLKSSEAMQDVKETSESWAEWVHNRITEGLGLGMTAEQMKDKAADIAMKTKGMLSDAASGAADVTSQEVGNAKEALRNKAGDVNGKTIDGADHAWGTAERAYHGAKQRMGEAYETARDTVTENARSGYEAAKEKVSQATGDMGASMNEKMEEL